MRKTLLVIAALPSLAACATGGPPRAPNTALPASFEAPQAPGAAVLERWWLAYGDTQLTALIEEALKSAPDAKIAEQRVIEARATARSQIFSAYPQGNLALGARTGESAVSGGGPFNTGGQSSSTSADFDVSWEIDLFGRTRTSRRAVDQNYAATIFNVEASRVSLAAGVADSLFAARGLAQQLEDAQQSLRIARELEATARTRSERGLTPGADLMRATAEVAQADATRVQIEAELRGAKRTLLVLLGRGTDQIGSLTIAPTPLTVPRPPAVVPGEVLQRRPDVREQEQRLNLVFAQLRIDRLALFPKFMITPGVGITRTTSEGITGFTAGTATFGTTTSTMSNWSVGANLSVPVLNRPQLLATVRASGARAEQAVINYERVVQTAYGEADTLLVQLAADRNRVALLAGAVDKARAAYDAAKARYDAGLDDLPTLLNAEQAWRGARSAHTAAQTQALRRSVQTFKALGGGWTPPAEQPRV